MIDLSSQKVQPADQEDAIQHCEGDKGAVTSWTTDSAYFADGLSLYSRFERSRRPVGRWPPLDELVVNALVIPFAVIVRGELS